VSSLHEFLGVPAPRVLDTEVIEKIKKKTPFDFANEIQFGKKRLIQDDQDEKEYNSFMVNRALSFGADTVIDANEMNCRPHIPKKMQFEFLLSKVRPRKRFNKWAKATPIEHVDNVKQYYGYNTPKALDALRILTLEQLEIIASKLYTGGKDAR
jgi:hypothetical protein